MTRSIDIKSIESIISTFNGEMICANANNLRFSMPTIISIRKLEANPSVLHTTVEFT